MKIVDLEKNGISRSVINRLTELGFNELSEVQKQAVDAGLFSGESLLIDSPTGTGKTFVGELAAVTASTKKDFGKTFFLIPLKALAEEKYEDFVRKYSEWGLRVAISTADHTEFDNDLVSFDIIISTYEKLNSLLIKNPELTKNIGLVIIDEVQNIGDSERGIVLEILLTRLLLLRLERTPQIIGLSATIPNAKDLAEWLDAKLVEVRNRDVDLREGILYTGDTPIHFLGNELNDGDFIFKDYNTGKIGIEPQLNIGSIEKIAEMSIQEPFIIFVNTQNRAQRVADVVTKGMPMESKTVDLIDELDNKVESTPITRSLKKQLQNGVAFHHAGLLPVERRIVEDGFRDGLIRVICSTTTLGAGVNTPAKNVVVLDYTLWDKRKVPIRDYKNMVGRAGRIRSKDVFGRSVLIADSEKEVEMFWNEYVTASPETVTSQIPAQHRLDCAILGLFASDICSSLEELMFFLKMTFFGHEYHLRTTDELKKYFSRPLEIEVERLIQKGLLEQEDKEINVTEIGRICAEEMLSPDTVVLFHDILDRYAERIKKAKDFNNFSEGIIHLCCSSPDASLLFLPKPTEQEELEAYWHVNNSAFFYTPKDKTLLLRSLRTSRLLMRWIDGLPYSELAGYAPSGIVKRTAENVCWAMNGLRRVADLSEYGFQDEFKAFLGTLTYRIFYGVPNIAIEIMKLNISAVHRQRAIMLAEANFRTADDLIRATSDALNAVNGIGDKLSVEIKKRVESLISDEGFRKKESQLTRARELGKDSEVITRLYNTRGKAFERACVGIFKDQLGFDARHTGDKESHGPDGVITILEGEIVIECKKKDNVNVTAVEAEEILGKGAKRKPLSYVTIGSPDFAEEARRNTASTGVTLLKLSVFIDILIGYWEGRLKHEEIMEILKSGEYIRDVSHQKEAVKKPINLKDI